MALFVRFTLLLHLFPFSVQHNNPLYVTPETEYKNPVLKKEDEEDDEDFN